MTMFTKLVRYLKEVRGEMAKVSWPSRNELAGATLLVVVLSIAVSIFVYICDKVLYVILTFFLRLGL
jgi:preprotein translocase subunit SecE